MSYLPAILTLSVGVITASRLTRKSDHPHPSGLESEKNTGISGLSLYSQLSKCY